MKKNIFTLFMVAILSTSSFGQGISFSLDFGYAKPGGTAFEDASGESMVGFGLYYGFDAMYMINKKLGAGLAYNGSALLGVSTGLVDAGLYGLGVYGAKAFLHLLKVKLNLMLL